MKPAGIELELAALFCFVFFISFAPIRLVNNLCHAEFVGKLFFRPKHAKSW